MRHSDEDRTIQLTQGKSCSVDPEDYETLASFKWFAMESNGIWYAARNRPKPARGLVLMHRQILDVPSGALVDHHDRNGLNNRRSNLRVANRSNNRANSKPQASGTSHYKGVHWSASRRRWVAKLHSDGRNVYLGQFVTEVAAAQAYDVAALREFGDFARVNFPVETPMVTC